MAGNVNQSSGITDDEFISIAETAAQNALAAQLAAEAAQAAAEQALADTLAALAAQTLGDHADVTITTPAVGDVLSFDGANWIDATLSTDALADINITGITDGQGVAWNASAIPNARLEPVDLLQAADFVAIAGDTMTGDLILNGAPTVADQAATKQYVDDQFTTTAPYDIGVFFDGVPGDGEDILKFVCVRDFFLLQNLPNSRAVAGVAATAITTFDLQRNGASIGSIQWAAAATTATFTLAANENFSAGDVLSIVGPTPADATLEDISITLVGNLGTSA